MLSKLTSSWQCETDELSKRIRKRKRRKDLEELRRNALAAKRNLKSRPEKQKSKTDFLKSLNKFASKRNEIEDAVQCQDSLLNISRNHSHQSLPKQVEPSFIIRSKNNNQSQDLYQFKTRIISDHILPKPLNLTGFFRAGIKGKLLTRPLTSKDKLRNAILEGDALQLMQSGNFCKPQAKKENSVDDDDNDTNPLTKMEISNLLNEFSQSSSDADEPVSVEKVKSSPVFGGVKGFKKNVNLIKRNVDKGLNNVSCQENQSPISKRVTKEDKCKRRLFEEEYLNVNRENTKYTNNNEYDNDPVRYSQRTSRPENTIFFTEYVPTKYVDNKSHRKHNHHKINPSDPKLISYYVQTCKIIAENDLKDIFRNILKDPMESAKSALKTTYANAFKDYLHRQKATASKQGTFSVDASTESSNSEIMLEPDSAIARTLKKNNELQMKNVRCISENNSDASTNNLNDLETDFPMIKTAANHLMKRKYVPSSKSDNSETEIPSSVKVNADPVSVKMKMKMNSIHPERQELIARYLKDVDTNSQHEQEKSAFNDQRNLEKELFLNDNVRKTSFVHKSTKHIPAILRKNKYLVDCVSEKKISVSIEKCPERSVVTNKSSMHDLNASNNVISERTPNCGNAVPNQSIEAPKCKYMYMNAKYNQPSRINGPPMQTRRCHRNITSQTMHLFPTPNVEKNFVIPQNVELSPIERQFSFPENKPDFQMFNLSQESSADIQERTNRLTLQSNQSQNCSEESIEHSNSNLDFYYRQYEPPNNCVPYNSQPCVIYNRLPTSQAFDVALNSNDNCHSQNAITCKEKPCYVSKPDFQMMPPENCSRSFRGTKGYNCCSLNDHQMYIQNSGLQEPVMACVPVQQQKVCQPVKFIAIEGNRMPQRRPIYGIEDSNSCSHTRKTSASNQQYTQVLKPCYSRDASNQPMYALSSIQYHSQEAPLPRVNPDFKYENVGNSSVQRLSNLNGEVPGSSRNLVNFVSNTVPDQSYIAQRGMPMHTAVHNQRCIGQQMQMQMPSPLFAQVAYQHNHCSNNEVYKINDIYLQEMNHNIHSKKP